MFASRCAAILRQGAKILNTTRTIPCLKRAIHISTRLSAAKLSEFRTKKFTEVFDHVYDTDNDGYIDEEDIEQFKKRVRVYMEKVHGRAMQETYKAGFDDFLYFILTSSGDDKGTSPREEWLSLWENLFDGTSEVKPEALPQWVRMVPHSIFPVLDCKGDGVVDPDEYRDFWHYVGGYRFMSDEDLERYFHHMTEGGKKPLDLERVEELFADFYLSDDPDTPGRYISGPIKL